MDKVIKDIGKQMAASLRCFLFFSLLTGLAYPLLVTALGNFLLPFQAQGSLITSPTGQLAGSILLGQEFKSARYFHGRPSATTPAYNAASSSASNLASSNAEFKKLVAERLSSYRLENGLAATEPVPVEMVTASASGLDPDISLLAARQQTARVARARALSQERLLKLVDSALEDRSLGVLGEPRVNVLKLNMALDNLL
jgi:K+-transporting ATPase ATPase C chain